MGINANVAGWGDASTQPRLDQVTSQTHTKWLREEFRWNTIEPSPGQFDFSYYDHFMLIAAQAGEHVLPVLYDTPPGPAPPTTRSRLTRAPTRSSSPPSSAATAPTAASGISTPACAAQPSRPGRLWNEPYYSSGDNGNYNPGDYARLVKAAAIAGRAADPNAKFLLASEMQSARDSNGNWQWWTDALYQAVPDLNNYFDGVAVHPYGTNTTSLNPDGPRPALQQLRQHAAHSGHPPAVHQPRRRQQALLDHRDRLVDLHHNPNCVTPAQQAANLTTLFADLHGSWSNWVQAAFLYHYTDGTNPTSNIQDGFGLTTNTPTPSPPWPSSRPKPPSPPTDPPRRPGPGASQPGTVPWMS